MADFLWWRDGVIYQIYPRSFADLNGDGIGDLPGIISHLDYLADLGIDAIWLSPFYPSPNVDFGYDITDHKAVDPLFGTMSDFDRLVKEAHARKIHIILDLVINHTSDQHPWFLAARSSRTNAFHDWYLWKDPLPGHKPPNNWESVVSGKAWEFIPEVGQYYYHAYFKDHPDLNWRNPEVRKAMLDVVRFWLDRDVDGYRLDVFNIYFKHPEFPDNPPQIGLRGYDRQRHVFDRDQPEMLPLLEEFRRILDAYPDHYMVGEPMFSNADQSAAYCGKNLLHQAFNFEFLFSPFNPGRYLNAVNRWEKALPKDAWPCYVLNNHDEPRSATRIHDQTNDPRSKLLAAMLLTLRGTPFIYNGEEIGMWNITLSRKEILDPLGKPYWPIYKGRDGSRSPMQWDASQNAGFSKGKPWLPLNPDFPQRNVLLQQSKPDSLLNFYRSLLAIRRQVPALQFGEFIPLTDQPHHGLAYLRRTDVQTVLVALNFSRLHQVLSLDPEIAGLDWATLLTSSQAPVASSDKSSLNLEPYEVRLLLSGH